MISYYKNSPPAGGMHSGMPHAPARFSCAVFVRCLQVSLCTTKKDMEGNVAKVEESSTEATPFHFLIL